MIRPVTLVTLLAAMGAGLHLYQTKHAVALLDRELRSIGRQIGEAQERTVALAAEWAWLNEPERLRAVAQRHLQLEPMQPAQFVRLGEAERRVAEAERRLVASAAMALAVEARMFPEPRREFLRADGAPLVRAESPLAARGEVAPAARGEVASPARGEVGVSRQDAVAGEAAPLRNDAAIVASAARPEPAPAVRREPAASMMAASVPARVAPRSAPGPQRPTASTVALHPAATLQSVLLPGVANAATGSALGGGGVALPPPVPFAR